MWYATSGRWYTCSTTIVHVYAQVCVRTYTLPLVRTNGTMVRVPVYNIISKTTTMVPNGTMVPLAVPLVHLLVAMVLEYVPWYRGMGHTRVPWYHGTYVRTSCVCRMVRTRVHVYVYVRTMVGVRATSDQLPVPVAVKEVLG